MSFSLMLSTAGSEKEAQKIGKALVEKSLAACVNIVPGVRSFFYWQGELCEEKEVMLLIKTTQRKFKKIIKAIKELHSYSVPEILSVKIERGEKRYLEWLEKMVEEKGRKGDKKIY